MISLVTSVKRLKIENRRTFWSILIVSIVGCSAIAETTQEALNCGGGAFIYLFILSALLLALPTLYMEIFLGQYTKRSATMAWRLMPISIGVWYYLSISAVLKSLVMSIHGTLLLHFLLYSLQTEIPWEVCPPSMEYGVICYNHELHKGNLSEECQLITGVIVCPDNRTYQLPTHIYYRNTFLDTETEPKGLMFGMTFSLLLTWTLALLIIFRSMYKCAKLLNLALISWVVWLVLITLITLMHDGSNVGFAYMFVVKQEDFIERKAWFRAPRFSIYYFTIGMPSTMAFSSRIKSDSKPIYDAMVMVTASCAFLLLYTCFNYSMMGLLAKRLGVDISVLSMTKSEVIFGVVPYYLNIMVLGHVMLILYYFLSFIITLLSLCICVSGIIQGLLDSFELREYRRYILVGYVTAVFLLLIPFMTKMGFRYYHPVLMEVVVGTSALFCFMLETVVVFWLYATSRLSSDILFFSRRMPTLFWKVLWRLIPAAAIGLFVLHIQQLYDMKSEYNKSAFFIAVILCITHILVVPILGIMIAIRFWRQGCVPHTTRSAFS